MSRIGLHAPTAFKRPACLFLDPLISSIAAVHRIFEHASGAVETRPGLKNQLPSAYTYLRTQFTTKKPIALHTLLRKLRRLGSVWSTPGRGAPDAVLENIDLKKEFFAELDDHLDRTLFLRSAPFTSLLLADIALADPTIYNNCLVQLQRCDSPHTPAVVSLVAQEIQARAVPTPYSIPLASQTLLYTSQAPVLLSHRRGRPDLVLSNFSSLDVKVGQNDYIILNDRLREDPDFPVAPFWHNDYSTQRSWLDTAMQVPEDNSSGFFAHEVLLKKILLQLNVRRVFPHAGKLRLLRSSAATEAQKLMETEAEVALANEPNRLLRCKIEQLMSRLTSNAEQHRALRQIPLDIFEPPTALEMSDNSIIDLMTVETQKILGDKSGAVDVDRARICDIVSEYSEDIDECFQNNKSVLDIICNDRKRTLIKDWIPNPNGVDPSLTGSDQYRRDSFESPDSTHGLSSGLELPKTPIRQTTQDTPRDPHTYPVLVFPRDKDGKIVLALDGVCSQERSAGFFTNLSGLTGISSSASGTGKGSVIDGDEETRAESATSVEPGSYSIGSSVCQKADVSSYGWKRIAMNLPQAYGARRLNGLRMGWDIPHRANAPQQPGLRPYLMLRPKKTGTRPCPDWDLPDVEKPDFAHNKSERGLLTLFNEQEDRKEILLNNGHRPTNTSDWKVVMPPRRPPHDELRTTFYNCAQVYAHTLGRNVFSQQLAQCEVGTMGNDGRINIKGQKAQALIAASEDDPFVDQSLASATKSGRFYETLQKFKNKR